MGPRTSMRPIADELQRQMIETGVDEKRGDTTRCLPFVFSSQCSSHHRFFRRRRDFPFVRALQAFPVVTACLRELRLGAEVAAVGARLEYRLVPDHEVARRIVGASVERLSALL